MDKQEQLNQIDAQIADILRIAGVKQHWQVQDEEQKSQVRALMNQKYVLTAPRVKDLIADLEKLDPEAIVIISEKWGRGAAQYHVRAGYTSHFMEDISKEETESYKYPAVEVSCAL